MQLIRVFLLICLLCSTGFGPLAAQKSASAPTTESVEAEIGELTLSIDAATRQVGDFGNGTPEKQKLLFKLVIELIDRAQKREGLERWNESQYDWFLALHYRGLVVTNTHLSLIESPAILKERRAWAYYNAGDLMEARRSVQEARADADWANVGAYELLAAAHISLYSHALEDAMADARAAEVRSERKRNAYIVLSLIHYRKGDLAAAREAWTKVKQIDPSYAAANPFDPQVAALNAALVRNPSDPKAWTARGDYFYRAGSSLGERPFADAAAAGAYLHAPPSFSRFRSDRAGFLDAAQRDFSESLRLAADPAVQAKRGLALFEFSRLPESDQSHALRPASTWKDDFTEARAKGFASFEAMMALGSIYDVLAREAVVASRADEAKAAWVNANFYESLAIAQQPQHAMVEEVRANIARRADQIIEASRESPISDEERVLANPQRTAEEWKQRGNQAMTSGDAKLALHDYEQALAKDFSYADAHNNIGMVYADMGDLPRAIAAWRTAIKLDPAHRIAHRNLAEQLLRLELPVEALLEATAAVLHAPGGDLLAEALAVRGAVRMRLGDVAGGIADWQAQAELQPGDPEVWQRIGKEALFDSDLETAVSALRRNLTLQPRNYFTTIFLAIAINAQSMQQQAYVLGKPVEELAYRYKEGVYPEARSLLEGIDLSDDEKNSLKATWNEHGEQQSRFTNDRSLRLSGEAVARWVLFGERKPLD